MFTWNVCANWNTNADDLFILWNLNSFYNTLLNLIILMNCIYIFIYVVYFYCEIMNIHELPIFMHFQIHWIPSKLSVSDWLKNSTNICNLLFIKSAYFKLFVKFIDCYSDRTEINYLVICQHQKVRSSHENWYTWNKVLAQYVILSLWNVFKFVINIFLSLMCYTTRNHTFHLLLIQRISADSLLVKRGN